MQVRNLVAALLCGIVTLAGCATAPPYTKPEYLGASFDVRAFTDVAAAPVLDMRIDKSEALDLDALVHATTKRLMAKRGYAVTTFADRSLINALQARLRLLSPGNVLARGYSITTDDATGQVIRAAGEVKPGQRLKTKLQSGEVRSVVEEVDPSSR